ncbi:MAG: carbohydrate kinase family protein [Nitrososphaerota archaeon]|nr:carbohydrate kinase family protein [Nitrososphaerota archaeon]
MNQVLVVGDLFYVQSARVDELPKAGDNLALSDSRVDFSGVGANVARDLARLDVGVRVFGAVGQDGAGRSMLAELRAAGVDVRLVTRVKAPTGSFIVLVDRSGERTMIGHRGASETVRLTSRLLDRASPDWAHVSGYTLLNAGQAAAFSEFSSAALERGIPLSVDLEGVAQAHRRIKLRGVHVFCNAFEYREYFGRNMLLNDCGAKSLVVKAGQKGAYLLGRGEPGLLRSFSARSNDSTGAGDAFNAGFIRAKLIGADDYEACVWGNACGSIKVAEAGPFLEASLGKVRHMVKKVIPSRTRPSPRRERGSA